MFNYKVHAESNLQVHVHVISLYEHSKKHNIHFTLPQTKIKGISQTQK